MWLRHRPRRQYMTSLLRSRIYLGLRFRLYGSTVLRKWICWRGGKVGGEVGGVRGVWVGVVWKMGVVVLVPSGGPVWASGAFRLAPFGLVAGGCGCLQAGPYGLVAPSGWPLWAGGLWLWPLWAFWVFLGWLGLGPVATRVWRFWPYGAIWA